MTPRPALAFVLASALAATATAAPTLSHSISTGAAAEPNATTCKMTYGGGPMIQHVKVFDVFYSPGNAYESMLADFYTGITQSAHFDMLQEYNVTGFKISRGSYIGKLEDTQTNPAAVTSVDPAKYLQGLLAANKLPPPDDDTIYMMYFPSNIDPLFIDGTTHSCISAATFCAYHASFKTAAGQLVRYGVMPDISAHGCAGGCGAGTAFANLCEVSSHELIEAVTDPDNNTAWVDRNNSCNPTGEIGDICATGAGDTGTIGSFTVQKEWSNTLGACVVSNPNIVVNDFTLAAPMAAVSVPQGGMATAMLTVTKVSGTGESLPLTATGLPSGVIASFSPASVSSAGGTAMMTLTASASAMLGMAKVTVKAAGTVVTRTQDVPIQIAVAPDMAMPPSASGAGNGTGGGTGGNGAGNGSGASMAGSGGGGASMGGCSFGGAGGDGGTGWAAVALLLLAFVALRRRA